MTNAEILQKIVGLLTEIDNICLVLVGIWQYWRGRQGQRQLAEVIDRSSPTNVHFTELAKDAKLSIAARVLDRFLPRR